MPIYTVTVDDGKGNIKTVSVDTAGMIANVVPKQEGIVVAEPVAEPVEQVNENLGLNGLFNPKGGKRSVPSFRLKKRRITRKLKKTR
jgi:hypothetical protein